MVVARAGGREWGDSVQWVVSVLQDEKISGDGRW